jgi:putative SOS response-associated peptidase YedK
MLPWPGTGSGPSGSSLATRTPAPHRWLSEAHRCLVPLTAFSEPERQPDGKSVPTWFALGDGRPLIFFAGI